VIRTVIAILVLFVVVTFLPWWFQLPLFLLAVLFVPYRVALYVPALYADILYAPTHTLSVMHLLMTLILTGFIILRWFIATKTRLANYASIS
jgi:hypothetical protein